MKELLKEFITDILSLSEAVPATHNPGDVWRTKGGFGAKHQKNIMLLAGLEPATSGS